MFALFQIAVQGTSLKAGELFGKHCEEASWEARVQKTVKKPAEKPESKNTVKKPAGKPEPKGNAKKPAGKPEPKGTAKKPAGKRNVEQK